MGIRIVYAPKASLVGEAAYQGGLGEFNRFSAQMWDRAQDRTQRERMQGASLAAQAESQDRQFRFQAERDQFQAQTQAESQALQAERQEALQSKQFLLGQFGADAQAERQQRLQEFEFTQQEKFYNAKLDKSLNWVQEQLASGAYTPEQAQDAAAQIIGLRKPPSKPRQTLAQQVEQEVIPVPPTHGGGWWYRQADGSVKYQMPPKDSGTSTSDLIALYDRAEKAIPERDAEGNPIQDRAALVEGYVDRALKLVEAVQRRQRGDQPGLPSMGGLRVALGDDQKQAADLGTPNNPVPLQSPDEVESLPIGAYFVDPDGNVRVKDR